MFFYFSLIGGGGGQKRPFMHVALFWSTWAYIKGIFAYAISTKISCASPCSESKVCESEQSSDDSVCLVLYFQVSTYW